MELPVLNPEAKVWYAEGLNFTCTQCGNCCTGGPGYVWINREEIDRLAVYLNLSAAQVIHQYCRLLGSRCSLNERRTPEGNYDCIFLREEKVKSNSRDQVTQTRRICTIYPVRPLQCRTWPFWDGNLASAESWSLSARRCPGMGRGKHYSLNEIESRRDSKDWPKET